MFLFGQRVDSILVSEQVKNFEIDAFGNFYIISVENELLRYDKGGGRRFSYSENRLGTLAQIDIKNPLKLLLYYPDFQVIKILDRTLNEIQTIELSHLLISQIPSVCLSADGNIWMLDGDAYRLTKISLDGRVLFQSTPLYDCFEGDFLPTKLIEQALQLYVFVPEKGIIQLDAFGAKQHVFHNDSIRDFQVRQHELWLLSEQQPQQIFIQNQYTEKTDTIDLITPVTTFRVHLSNVWGGEQENAQVIKRLNNPKQN